MEIEKVYNFLQDWMFFPKNPEFIDYVILGIMIVIILAILFLFIQLLVLILKWLYNLFDTIGVSLKEGCGEITDKQIVKGFEVYSRTGPITIEDQFVLQIKINDQYALACVYEDYFVNVRINNKVEVAYILGRLSKNIIIKNLNSVKNERTRYNK